MDSTNTNPAKNYRKKPPKELYQSQAQALDLELSQAQALDLGIEINQHSEDLLPDLKSITCTPSNP